MTAQTKRLLLAALLVAVIAAACAWIYFAEIRTAQHNVALHQHIGRVLAERTSALVGKQGRIVTIAIETREWPELKTQRDAFKAELKKLGEYEVREYEMDTKDQPKYGVGSGLSGRRYVRTVKKNPNASAFVSFVGAPKLGREEIAELGDKPPLLIVECRSTDNLPALFEKKLIAAAVVSRFQFPAPGPENPRTPEEWFTKRYQVVVAQGVANLPKAE